uniref:Fatty acid synthase pseudo-KR domain-containing protein n=1 Tax=Timema bartmani TaxID=61472 RepID=A0A7R9F755_9NEOP|nr:unnamed protein product [Timema bartmani]
MCYTHIAQTQPLYTALTRTPLIHVRMSPLHALTVMSFLRNNQSCQPHTISFVSPTSELSENVTGLLSGLVVFSSDPFDLSSSDSSLTDSPSELSENVTGLLSGLVVFSFDPFDLSSSDSYIFILDKNAPKFSLNKDFYRQQLIQDLLVNFYENGSWGSFRQLPIDELREFSPLNGLLPELRLEKIKINNVGLNLRDPSIEVGLKEMGLGELGHLELSGITDDGTRFMSVVQNKGDITEKSLDPYLTWEIPEPWSMEDAATVPLAYATVNIPVSQSGVVLGHQMVPQQEFTMT